MIATAAVVVMTGCGRDRGAGDDAGVARPSVAKFRAQGEPLITTAHPVPGPTGTCGTILLSHGPVESGEVHVDGLSCEEAWPVLVGAWAWAPVAGPDHVDAAGFSCDRVDQTTEPLRVTYRCTRGSQSVWFVSTGRS